MPFPSAKKSADRTAKRVMQFYESELKVMELIWENDGCTAAAISEAGKKKFNWDIHTTYTMVTKVVKKGYAERVDPKFHVHALISKDQVTKIEGDNLMNRLYGGSKKALFSALLGDEKLTKEEIAELREVIEKR